jgi:ankyrin repeat protein
MIYMKKNKFELYFTLFLLQFLCCFVLLAQEQEKEKRARALAWKKNQNNTLFTFCTTVNLFTLRTKKEKDEESRKKQENKEFKALFKKKHTDNTFKNLNNKKPLGIKQKSAQQQTPPLHKSCKNNDINKATALILGRSVDIYQQDKNGDTPIHIACKNNCIAMVKLLCKCSTANFLEVKNAQGLTAFHIVCMNNYTELLAELTYHRPWYCTLDINSLTAYGLTPLNLACIQKHTDMVKKLLCLAILPKVGDLDESTPLHHAVENGSIDIITLLLSHHKTNPNLQDKVQTNRGGCFFHIIKNNTPLHIACYKKNVEAVKLLLKHPRIDKHIKNADELTPLNIAQFQNNTEIIELLLAA